MLCHCQQNKTAENYFAELRRFGLVLLDNDDVVVRLFSCCVAFIKLCNSGIVEFASPPCIINLNAQHDGVAQRLKRIRNVSITINIIELR